MILFRKSSSTDGSNDEFLHLLSEKLTYIRNHLCVDDICPRSVAPAYRDSEQSTSPARSPSETPPLSQPSSVLVPEEQRPRSAAPLNAKATPSIEKSSRKIAKPKGVEAKQRSRRIGKGRMITRAMGSRRYGVLETRCNWPSRTVYTST